MCSSTMETILIGLPSVVESNWKSTAHTRFGASAVMVSGAVEEPSRFRRRRCGTRRPSSRHSRWTFLWLTSQPSPRRRGRRGDGPIWVGFGVVAQPLPQCGVRVDGCVVGWLVALGCSVLPGHSAAEPFTHAHRVDEVVHGRAPACRLRSSLTISFSAAISSSASARIRFSVAFSFWRSTSLVVVGLQPTELVPPPVVGLLRYLELAADVGDVLAVVDSRSASVSCGPPAPGCVSSWLPSSVKPSYPTRRAKDSHWT